jgi:hypothetical protein
VAFGLITLHEFFAKGSKAPSPSSRLKPRASDVISSASTKQGLNQALYDVVFLTGPTGTFDRIYTHTKAGWMTWRWKCNLLQDGGAAIHMAETESSKPMYAVSRCSNDSVGTGCTVRF